MTRRVTRRTAVALVASGLTESVMGCLRGPSVPDVDVVAGPGGAFTFEPEALSVGVGDNVSWGFESSGHNVSGRPDHSELVELPDGANPFSSYRPGMSPLGSHVLRGETYDHTFDVAGRYDYVCVPHVGHGMIGTVHVGDTG